MKELTEKRNIDAITTEILFYKQQAGTAFLEIGKRMTEVKAQLNHGEWLGWLKNRVDFSVSMADKLMKVAREFSNSESIPNLGVAKALALLAVPAEERERFAEEVHAEDLSVRALKEKIQQREEQLAAAEQDLDKAQRALTSRQMELNAQKERSASLAQERQTLLDKLAELENRPVEVATVDATEEQLREAEQRGMEHNQWELDVAKRQLTEQAERAARLQERLDEKQRELRHLQQEAEDASEDTRINQTLGEINAWAREMQEAHRRITELLGNLDDLSRKRVQDLRRKLLRRMLEEIK